MVKPKSESHQEARKVSTMTTTDKNKSNLKASYEFENGRARIIHRGVSFWNGTENEISAENPMRTFDSLVYELLGAEEVWSDQYELKGIRITVEIEESRIQ